MDMLEIRDLLRELESADWRVRRNVIKTLLGCAEESYLPFLEEALRDHGNATLRNASMDFYRTLDSRALPSLLRLVRDDDPEVRLFAVNLLGDIADGRAVPELVEAMKDDDVNVRIACAEAMGKIGAPGTVPALREALGDEPWVTMAAVKALGDIGGDSALAALYGFLEREEYRGITFEAIERAGDGNAIKYLIPFADRDDLRELALKALVTIAEREKVGIMPEYFMALIPLLVELQHSPHSDLRRAGFIALAWSEDVGGLPYFIEGLNDDELQEYAIDGIMGVGEKGIPGIINALRDPGQPQRYILAKILSTMGGHEALIQFSGDHDPEVRVEVALALGQSHSARAEAILSGMLDDPDGEVRSAAGKTLRKFKG